MYKNVKYLVALGLASILSPSVNAVSYVDNFETTTDGWNVYFLDRSAGDCSGGINYQQYLNATPNTGGQGAGGQTYAGNTYLNVYSIYDQYTNGGLCRTVKVYKEQALNSSDAGAHNFSFTASAPLGTEAQYAAASGVPVSAFIEVKLGTAPYTVVVSDEISTVGDGQKDFTFVIPTQYANSSHLISYGFKVVADHPSSNGNDLKTGRWYDDVSVVPLAYSGAQRDPNDIPVLPLGGLIGLIGLIGWMGWRRKA